MGPTLAIVRRRLDGAYAFDWSVRLALPLALAATFAPLFGRSAVLLVLMVLLPLAASTESTSAQALRRTSLFAMPLYGRQLARALSIGPALTAVAAPLGFSCGLALRGGDLGVDVTVVALCANVAGALVALGAVFREGANAWLYYALTLVTGTVIAAPLLFALRGALWISLAIALLIVFAALRAFGETLARYDPLP